MATYRPALSLHDSAGDKPLAGPCKRLLVAILLQAYQDACPKKAPTHGGEPWRQWQDAVAFWQSLEAVEAFTQYLTIDASVLIAKVMKHQATLGGG